MEIKRKIQKFFGIYNCENCTNKMDKESKDFCKEYKIDWCLDCCGEDMVSGNKMYNLSIPVYRGKP